MKLIKYSLFFIFCLLLISQTSCNSFEKKPITIYVSSGGNDVNNGSYNAPFLTLEHALIISRKAKGKKTIIVKKGNYYNVNLSFTKKDKGLTIIAEEGSLPNLFGGLKLEGFKKEGNLIYTIVKGTKNRDWDFRMIQVNGRYKERARLPREGAFIHLNKFDVRWLSSEAGGWERKPTQIEKTTLKYKLEDINPDIDINNAELTIYHEWDETLVGLKGNDTINNVFEFINESGHPPGAFAKRNANAQTFVVWNTTEGMSRPGQWYLDRTRERLYYWPEENEDVSTIKVVVPTHQSIFSFENNSKDITIEGLTLSSTTTKLVTGGYGAMKFEGAISGKKVSDITLSNLIIKNVGGWGIKLSGKNITINESEIFNCGAGAVVYTGKNIEITNNKLHDIGLIYMSAVGIFGKGDHNKIIHNEIYNMPYCGINGIGNNSMVEGNVIHNIKTFMQDGGAIYMFGHKNTVVKNNVVLSKLESGIKVYAYYLDEGCENCVVENNLSCNAIVPVQAHMTRNCIYQNNVFIDKGSQTIAYANSSDLTFDKNILIADSIIFKGPTKTSPQHVKGRLGKVMSDYSSAIGITSWKNNIFNSKSGIIDLMQLAQYDLIKKSPLQPLEGTLLTDPLLDGVSSGNLISKKKSQVESMGIILHDFSNAGYKTNLAELIQTYYLE